MNTLQKFIAKNAILKYINSQELKNKDADLVSQLDRFENLDVFFEYFVLSKGAPLNCLPYSYVQNRSFLIKLFNKKNSLINEIYGVNNQVYHEILASLDLNKFLKRCKFALRLEIKKEIAVLRGSQAKADEISALIPAPNKKTDN